MHNAWLMLEGDKKKSKEFIMHNSAVHKLFRKGNTDTFSMEGRYVGKLKRVILGAMQREDKPHGKKISVCIEFILIQLDRSCVHMDVWVKSQ